MSTGVNVKNLKEKNRAIILTLLNKGRLSRKELAQRTGLTSAAVTKLCAELIADGLVREVGPANIDENIKKSGRREILLEILLSDKFVLGVNAEKDTITFSVCNLAGELFAQESMEFCTDLPTVIDRSKRFVEKIGCKLFAVGVCTIGSPSGYGAWKDVNVKESFSAVFGVNTIVKNNVRAFAEAEILYGNLKNEKSVLFFKWGPGVGSAIVFNGKVFSGNDDGIAEIGHYIINGKGKKCRCGRCGCLETEVSADIIDREIETQLATYENQDKEQVKKAVIESKLKSIARALLNTATILDARKVVLFGSVFSEDWIAMRLVEIIKDDYPEFLGADISYLNEKRHYIGAVAICLKELVYNSVNAG